MWISIAHRREHTSNMLPLLICQQRCPLNQSTARHQATLLDYRYGLVHHTMYLFTPPLLLGTHCIYARRDGSG